MERLKHLNIASNFASEMMEYVEDWRRNPVICLKWHNISKLNRRSIEEKSEHNTDFSYAKLLELEFSSEFSPEFDQIWKITSNPTTSTPSSPRIFQQQFGSVMGIAIPNFIKMHPQKICLLDSLKILNLVLISFILNKTEVI